MTPEERWTKIENLLLALTESAARHDEMLARHDEWLTRHDETLTRQQDEIDKLNAGIRDLIVVSRTLLDSHKESREDQKKAEASIQELRDLHKDTEEKLNALIHTVDRLIRRGNQNGE